MTIEFTKMQGLGNDFVVINALDQPFTLSGEKIRAMADRRLGVGFDQLLVLEPTDQVDADFSYRIFNADGGEVGQCGNGARCMGLFIKHYQLSDKQQITLITREGRLQITLDNSNTVTVTLSKVYFAPQKIPFVADQESLSYPLTVEGKTFDVSVVNVGNPHAVMVVDRLDDDEIYYWGQKISRHARFPQGVNVGFMQIIHSQKIALRVFERGAGMTLACGSGACAAVAVGYQRNLLSGCVEVNQAGGRLLISFDKNRGIEMIGGANLVFTGNWLHG